MLALITVDTGIRPLSSNKRVKSAHNCEHVLLTHIGISANFAKIKATLIELEEAVRQYSNASDFYLLLYSAYKISDGPLYDSLYYNYLPINNTFH